MTLEEVKYQEIFFYIHEVIGALYAVSTRFKLYRHDRFITWPHGPLWSRPRMV